MAEFLCSVDRAEFDSWAEIKSANSSDLILSLLVGDVRIQQGEENILIADVGLLWILKGILMSLEKARMLGSCGRVSLLETEEWLDLVPSGFGVLTTYGSGAHRRQSIRWDYREIDSALGRAWVHVDSEARRRFPGIEFLPTYIRCFGYLCA